MTRQVLALFATSLLAACQGPEVLPAALTLAPPAPDPALARERLSARNGADFSLSLIGSPQRWGRGAGQRTLQAFGDPATASWTNGGKAGVPLTALGCTATDKATNGVAARHLGARRAIVITREGKLLDLDTEAPTSGAVVTNLDTATGNVASTFTKTYVSLSFDASRAFVVSDEGNAFVIDLNTVTAGAHPAKRASVGQGACIGTAVFIDPLAGGNLAYVVSNSGYAVKLTYNAAAMFAASTFTASTVAKVTGITTALDGGALVKAPPLVLGGVIYVGDRRGILNRYTPGGSPALTSWTVNPGWPIETPVAVDVTDDLDVTDIFVAAGPKLTWVVPSTGAIRQGQNALVEKGGPSGTITPATVASFLDVGQTTLQADWNARDAFTLYKTNSAGAALPEAPGAVDILNVGYGEKVTGQPPAIAAYAGTGGTSGGVADYTELTAAALNNPWALDVEGNSGGDDGSMYVANTNAGQVLYRPSGAGSSAKWTTTYAGVILDPTRFYEICGDADGGATAIGARGTSTGFRKTQLQTIRDVAVGNLGLYLINNNGWNNNAVLFLPKVGVTNAYGLNVTAERLYVLSRNGDPMGLCVDRRTPGKDIVYLASSTQANNNTQAILKLDSSVNADVSVFANGGGLSTPNDVCLDDKGNLIVPDPGATKVFMRFVGGAGNTRTWGITAPAANTWYTILSNAANISPWHVAYSGVDPQAPTGCLYLVSTQWGAYSHAIYRLDDSGRLSLMAGKPQSGGFSGNGGPATNAQLNAPRGLCPDAGGAIYLCDTANQRIRKLTPPANTGPEARGYLRFNFSSWTQRPVLRATLTLVSRAAGLLPPPLVGVASPFLPGTSTPWTADNVSATAAPDIDFAGAGSSVVSPATTGGNWNLAVGTQVKFDIAPGAFAVGSSTPYLCLGLGAPVDGNDYYYAGSTGIPAGGKRAFAFDTPRSNSGNTPKLEVVFGNTYVVRPILSPPSLYGFGTSRKVMVVNGNSLFRYPANPAAPGSFSTSLDFTYGRVMRYYSDGAKIYTPSTSFQPNAAPPFVDYGGRVYTLDVRFQQWNNTAYYALNAFDAGAAGANMAIGANGLYKEVTPLGVYGQEVAATADDNSGIYMTSGPNLDEAFFGLSNGRLYRVSL